MHGYLYLVSIFIWGAIGLWFIYAGRRQKSKLFLTGGLALMWVWALSRSVVGMSLIGTAIVLAVVTVRKYIA